MEPAHVKEVLSFLDRIHLFGIQNKRDGNLQCAMEGIINMVKDITIRSEKQTSILSYFFFHRLVFFVRCLCRKVLECKS